jgi:hypothetical protein
MDGPSPWLIDEVRPVGSGDEEAIRDSLGAPLERGAKGAEDAANIALRLQDLIIHDNRKWFGEARIRIDALVVYGRDAAAAPDSFYTPQTFRFDRVSDGDRLPTGDGLLAFVGRPAYFLDFFLTVSRDRGDSDDLATLLSKELAAEEMRTAMASLLGLAIAAPHVTAVTAAVAGAAVIGNLAYRALTAVTGATVGLYRSSWLQARDDFGVGRHPEHGVYREKDLAFWFEVVRDLAAPGS